MKPPDPHSENPFPDHFPGEVLEDLEDLPNYNDWIVGQFAPTLKGRTAEIGAGIGSISERIRPYVDSLDLIEPAPELASRLQQKFSRDRSVRVFEQSLELWLESAGENVFDGIALVNVLEHIRDDRAAVRGFYNGLKPDGRLMIFVPACPFLYSKLDHLYGHYRRYSRSALMNCVASAGFTIEKLKYFDAAGVLPWWLLNTVMGKTSFHAPSLQVYDKLVVPITKACESVVRPPLGKNLLLIARKQ